MTKVPVLIYLDFEAGRVARYLGRTRTILCELLPEAAQNMRTCDWREVLTTIRYRPQELDPTHPEAA